MFLPPFCDKRLDWFIKELIINFIMLYFTIIYVLTMWTDIFFG